MLLLQRLNNKSHGQYFPDTLMVSNWFITRGYNVIFHHTSLDHAGLQRVVGTQFQYDTDVLHKEWHFEDPEHVCVSELEEGYTIVDERVMEDFYDEEAKWRRKCNVKIYCLGSFEVDL